MKLLVGFFLLFLLPGSAIAFWDGLNLIIREPFLLKFILIGICSGCLIYFILLRKWNYFLTFEHELTHAFMSLLFLRKIQKFIVTKYEGGYIQHSSGAGGEFGDIMIKMAPYYFPTFTIIGLLFQPLIPANYKAIFIIFIGFTLIFHHLSTLKETIENWTSKTFTEAGGRNIVQTDIASTGFVFSFIYILTMTLFFNALVFWFLKYSYGCLLPLMKEVLSETLHIYGLIFSKVSGQISSVSF
jgi:hypothetical protein